eukprot:sb/3466518/
MSSLSLFLSLLAVMVAKFRLNKYEEIPIDQKLSRQETVDTTLLRPPPPDTIIWVTLCFLSLTAFGIGLTGLLTTNFMIGEIDSEVIPKMMTDNLKAFVPLPEGFEIPEVLKLADFGLFSFCFSEEFMTIVTSALKATNSEIPENEGGMKIDFSVACHKVIETENQPELMKSRTRTGKILMFMGLSSLFVTWLFIILVIVAGRHLTKVIACISASVTVCFLVTSLLVSMTLQDMTKDYLNLEIMRSIIQTSREEGINIDFIESIMKKKLILLQPVEIRPGYSGFLMVASIILTICVGEPIRTRYLGHVTGYQPIRGQYFLTLIPLPARRPSHDIPVW